MPLPGVSGSLVTASYIDASLDTVFAGRLGESTRERAMRDLHRWVRRTQAALGPASADRAVIDIAVVPLLRLLGYEVDTLRRQHGIGFVGRLLFGGQAAATALVLPFGLPVGGAWRTAVRAGIDFETRWVLATNGVDLDLVDADRTWSRRVLSFDLRTAAQDRRSAALVWALARAESVARGRDGMALVDLVAAASDRHGSRVCAALGEGVLEAVSALLLGLDRARRGTPDAPRLFDDALTIVYRVLFLLFAEARGLVPTWHHVYRDAYTIDGLCRRLAERAQPVGLWEALQALARLLHDGCQAGDLKVTPFNGRLFAPAHAPLAARVRVPDRLAAQALLALATGPTAASHQRVGGAARRPATGRQRIAYADLGVEQLGAVYERVLEYEAVGPAGAIALQRTSRARKSTGSFYTPRSMTDFLVRRTLHPLVEGRSAAEILSLRIVDPAMGSGAFLVAACRYLSDAVERALVADGSLPAGGAGDAERTGIRRQVAERCLYGVDINATAVQVARLSLWLYTLASDRPLSFLDHHLAAGDSLIGARLSDLSRPPGRARRSRSSGAMLALFDEHAEPALASAVPERFRLALESSDTVTAVRDKEHRLRALESADGPLARWRAAADAWCAAWFRDPVDLSPRVLAELTTHLLGRRSALPRQQLAALTDAVSHFARARRPFHWELMFPEVFFDESGRRRPDAGFDAVLGNPPWEVLRSDPAAHADRADARRSTPALVRFFRDAGIYSLSGGGHPNQYQLFLERAWQIVRSGGRFGLILPSGLAADHGSAHLRRALLTTTCVESLIGFDNRAAIFPIHRSTRFLLLVGTHAGETPRLRCRFGLHDPSTLDRLADRAADDPAPAYPVRPSRTLLERWDPHALTIPELADPHDVGILTGVADRVPPLGHADGWHLRFGRELNATDDRAHFVPLDRSRPTRHLLPIVEGKHIEPFRVSLDAVMQAIPVSSAARLIDPARSYSRARVAYRDVSGRTNRLTLIAAVLPAGAISTHTIFCAKSALDDASALTLVALLNSLTANYLVRLRVTTHVTTALMSGLPVPRPPETSTAARQLRMLARRLQQAGIEGDVDAYARLNAVAAELYGLTSGEYAHVVGTFPLLGGEVQEQCLATYGKGG